MCIMVNKNFVINSMIILFLSLIVFDFCVSKYFELRYKKELKSYGKDRTYFSVGADIIGLTSLASISDIAIVATNLYQRLILVMCLLLAFFYSCRIIYLDWEDIINSAKKKINKNKSKSNLRM